MRSILLFTFLHLLSVVLPLRAQPAGTKPLIIAHRGASGSAPENTIASINKALEFGADVIEIDVHQTKDSIVIVMHDAKLDRTTDKKGLIKDFNWNEIKDADAGSWFGEKFYGEKILTLDEVIRHINGRAVLLIEIKKDGKYYPGIERRILDIIKNDGAEKRCMIQAFSDAAVENFLSLGSEVPVFKLALGKKLDYAPQVAGVNPNYRFARKSMVKKIHGRARKIFVWTVNKEKTLRKMGRLGVDGIITNYPDRAKQIFGTNQ